MFLGDRNGIQIASGAPASRIEFARKTVECKESRIGKMPIEVPSNVTVTLLGQDLKVKGPLGELSRSYPREVKLVRENESGQIKVSKAIDTRRANQMHGLFRYTMESLFLAIFVICNAHLLSFLLLLKLEFYLSDAQNTHG